MIVSAVIDTVRSFWKQPSMGYRGPYPFAAIVADAAGVGLQIVEEMSQRFRMPIEPADKAGKKGVIDVLNSDLLTGQVKILPAAMGIVEEWQTLIWDEKEKAKYPVRWLEDGRFDNHLADAFLYAWRKSRNYAAYVEPEPRPAPGTERWQELQHEEELARWQRARPQDGILVDEEPPWLRSILGEYGG
jgi:hypothetical protein